MLLLFTVTTLLFIDDVADNLKLYNATVVIIERDQGVIDVLRWIEKGRFLPEDYDIISLMVGRSDARRSVEWFMASIGEFVRTVRQLNNKALILLGAVVPSREDTKAMVESFVLKNAALQDRCKTYKDRRYLEYCRPGRELLAKGGPLEKFYGEDSRLNQLGLKVLAGAIHNKYLSASLPKRVRSVQMERC